MKALWCLVFIVFSFPKLALSDSDRVAYCPILGGVVQVDKDHHSSLRGFEVNCKPSIGLPPRYSDIKKFKERAFGFFNGVKKKINDSTTVPRPSDRVREPIGNSYFGAQLEKLEKNLRRILNRKIKLREDFFEVILEKAKKIFRLPSNKNH